MGIAKINKIAISRPLVLLIAFLLSSNVSADNLTGAAEIGGSNH